MEKLEWHGYPTVKKSLICLSILTQYRRVTDEQADEKTSCESIDHVMHTHCTVKTDNRPRVTNLVCFSEDSYVC